MKKDGEKPNLLGHLDSDQQYVPESDPKAASGKCDCSVGNPSRFSCAYYPTSGGLPKSVDFFCSSSNDCSTTTVS
jgi:hypothetical protein